MSITGRHRSLAVALIAAGSLAAAPVAAKTPAIPSEAELVGQEIGSDYFLANYTQLLSMFETLAKRSDRAKLVDIGPTAEGRRQVMMIVSSPANMKKLDRYRAIAGKLAKGRVSEAEAQALAADGKAVIWIDGGQHAAESVHAQSLMKSVYHYVTDDSAETRRILDNVVILFGHANPDGQELVADWYMRWPDPKDRPVYNTQGGALPRSYQKYIGHDNNRDWYTVYQPETVNISRVLFREWYPQVVYNHHQPGPDGMVVFMPPFRDPFNYVYDPLVISQLGEVGNAMHSRLIAEGKAGSGKASTANYSTWFNGSLRTVSYFHNAIGILTEIIGSPTPFQLSLTAENQLPRNDLPMPIAPRMWHLSDTLAYELSANKAVLDYAAANREKLLMNSWRMASNMIARGSRDSWTTSPSDIAALEAAARAQGKDEGVRGLDPRANPTGIDVGLYDKVLRDPARRDPRGFIIPSSQRDFPRAVGFVNSLIRSGVEVERATAPFAVAGKSYPAGSLVVKSAQAYRAHVLDMFEPQDHPTDLEYEGGPPKKPYDVTGYTLAYQVGVEFDRVLEGFEGPFEPVADEITPPPGQVTGNGQAGWIVDHGVNNSFILTNRLKAAGESVSWLKGAGSVEGHALAPGAIWIPASAGAKKVLEDSLGPLGLDAVAVSSAPSGDAIALTAPRIGLVDLWSGLMPSGWIRWVFEQYEFPYQIVRPQRLDAGDLAADFDVIVFPDAAFVGEGHATRNRRPIVQPEADEIPAEYRSYLGTISDKTIDQVEAFVRGGGTLLALGSSSALYEELDIPVRDAMQDADGKRIAASELYVPGSVMRMMVDNTRPLGFGMPTEADMFFDNSIVFSVPAGAAGIEKVTWFGAEPKLRSGWALGEEKLAGTSGVLDVSLGKGKVFLFGPPVIQRAQAQGSFKLFFNAIHYGPALKAAAQSNEVPQ